MKQIFAILIMSIVFNSCATLKEPKLEGTLTENDLTILNGNYNNFPNDGGGLYVNKLTDIFDRNTNIFKLEKDDKYDSESITVSLTSITDKTLNVRFSENNKTILDKNIKVRLKRDGFLYIKDKILLINGLPLIFGGWNIQKSRITILANGKLYVESNYFFCNGALIVMSDWKNFNYNLTFNRK